MRKPKEECTLSEYQFFWCDGPGHRESGTAMRPGTICAACAREWYGMRANAAIVEERAACEKIADSVLNDVGTDTSEYGAGYSSAAGAIRNAIRRRGGGR